MMQTTERTGSNSQAFGATPKSAEKALSGPSRASKIHFQAIAAGTSDTTCGMKIGRLVEAGEARPGAVVDERGEHQRDRDGDDAARRRR